MNIYFCGIGGAGLSPLALLAQDAGWFVCGSDAAESLGTKELSVRGVDYSLDQTGGFLDSVHSSQGVDLLVYSSAIPSDHPEIVLAKSLGIRCVKRSDLINIILQEKKLKLLAVAGTHGKTTTTAMVVWLFKQLGVPVSYSIGSQISFGPSAQYVPGSEWFVYECDEFDRNFLDFYPDISIITTIDYDHPDTYPTQEEYLAAFIQFANQSTQIIYFIDSSHMTEHLSKESIEPEKFEFYAGEDVTPYGKKSAIILPGNHNKENAFLAVEAVQIATVSDKEELYSFVNTFPGTARRFEKLKERVYTDYAHHPVEIQATIQLAAELYDRVVIVYQPHQNIRQYAVRGQYDACFLGAEKVFWLPTYLSREDGARILTPQELSGLVHGVTVVVSELNDDLFKRLQAELSAGACIVAMGAGSVDEWMRTKFLEIE
jgi:UDP-N-acetylmuramate--alanine ligase